MSLTLIIVVLLGAGFGYWMVANYIDGRREQAARKSQARQVPRNAPPEQSGPTWYQVLGIDANASPERIREAYQQQISLYHPDKVANMGPEIQALASRKAQDINLAYAEGLRLHR